MAFFRLSFIKFRLHIVLFTFSLVAISKPIHAESRFSSGRHHPQISKEAIQDVMRLKMKEPHWRAEVLSYFPDGAPQRVMLYETKQNKGDNKIPRKEIYYYPSGQVRVEMDVVAVSEEDPVAKEWQSSIVPDGMCVSFFEEGQVEKTAHYVKGRLQGEVKLFYPEGKLCGVASFKNGIREGKGISFYKNGTKGEEVVYSEDKIVGDLIRYYENGEKAALIPHKEGKMEGTVLEWYPTGGIKSTRRYREGKLHSEGQNPAVVFYDEQRNMIDVQDFRQDLPVGYHIKYHPNGKESYRVFYKEGKKEGKEQFFSVTGKLIGEGTYLNGTPIGLHIKEDPETAKIVYRAKYDQKGVLEEPIVEYSAKGVKLKEYQTVQGKLHGEAKQWYENGEIRAINHYDLGEFEGEQQEFFLNGKEKEHSFYQNHKKEGPQHFWYENGNLAAELHFKEGKKEGASIFYFENGAKKREEYYSPGEKLDQLQRFWHPNGILAFEGRFSAGKKEGLHQKWNEDGVLVESSSYLNDLPDGNFAMFYDKDRPKKILPFKQGKKEGTIQEWYENGQLKAEAPHIGDMPHGEVKGWYEDGSVLFVKFFKNGVPCKEHKEYYPYVASEGEKKEQSKERYGQLKQHFIYNNEGLFDGEQKTFYPDGKPQSILSFIKGDLHGLKALWDQEGELLEEATYKEGKLEGSFFEKDQEGRDIYYRYKENVRHGLHEIYYPPHQFFGKVKALEVPYIDGEVEGMVIEYNEAGTKMSAIPYKKGKKEGIGKFFSPQGHLFVTITFNEDKQSGPTCQYFPSGKLKKECTLVNEEKEGEEKAYFENGALASKAFYVHGKKEGLYQEWNEKGILVFEGEYKGGLRNGKFNKYYDNGKPKLLQFYAEDKLHGMKRAFDEKGIETKTEYKLGNRVS